MAFAGHQYGRPSNGTPAVVGQDYARGFGWHFRSRMFAKDTLRVVVVGDIDAKTLGGVLDTVFGPLTAKANLTPVAARSPRPPTSKR